MNEEEIFHQVIALSLPEERAAYLQRACAGDPALRASIEALLRANEGASHFLGRPAAALTAALDQPIQEGPGTVIGPYKLLEQIGEGGMGVVYMAEQTQPVRRKVALKIIKPGMDTKQVIARFEAERQALAMMDHPNIARVYDAGATESGRPYFVMELVRGIPITEYCDHHRLSIPVRLGLFMQVCQAVQHAHQKGIIHRDIKPTNVLVTSLDGSPLPKVIDFGIAKATGQSLTDKTLFTGFAQLIGTPLYMSPEQAELSAVDVDTRSDIYSLGVLLYELLTGTTPFDQDTFRTAALDEVRRIIREQEPPKPSTRLSGLGAKLTTVSENRQTDARKLNRSLRGELDWIVMKALEKDRRRRYETPSGLARDVGRYLAGDPVEAGPPSAWYRLRKAARRNRAATVVAAALVAGTVVSTWQAWRATRAEELARQRLGEVEGARAATATALQQSEEARAQADATSTFLVEALSSPNPSAGGREVKVADVLDRASAKLDKEFAGSPVTKGALLEALGKTYQGLGLYDKAVNLLTKAAAVREAALGPDHPHTLFSRNDLAIAYWTAGRRSEATALFEATLKIREAALGPDHPDTLALRNNLASAYLTAGRTSEAIPLLESTLKIREAALGPDHRDTLASRHNLASAYRAAGRYSEAIPLLESTLKLKEAKLGPDHPSTLASRHNLADAYLDVGRTSEAIPLLESTLKLEEAKLGPDHPGTLDSRNSLADAYLDVGRTSEAIELFESTLKLYEAKQGPDHPDTLTCRHNLAGAYQEVGRTSEAIALYESTLKLFEAKLGPDHPQTLYCRNSLAGGYRTAGRMAEAIRLYEETLKLRTAKLGPDHPHTCVSMNALTEAYLSAERWTEAESVSRKCLAIRETKAPDDWSRFDTMSQLGRALLGQDRYAEAEPLIARGYEGLKAREAKIPAPSKLRLSEAAGWVVQLYEAWGKPEKAVAWKARLGLADLPAGVFAWP
jgi:serine/threonine protein kinase/tetratricopeptide (TPR) repeat protein